MKVLIACDHGGFRLKQEIVAWLTEKEFELQDLGCYGLESVDYPDYAKRVAEEVKKEEGTLGILICGTGIGMAISANKVKGIRCACVSDTFSARMSREHNDANILALGERVIGPGLAKEIVDVWLHAQFQGGRHLNRIEKMKLMEGHSSC